MYRCDFCKIFLSHSNFEIINQHEKGNRHKINKAYFFGGLLLEYLSKIIIEISYFFLFNFISIE